MVTAVCWVKKGYAKAMLELHNPDDQELKA